MADDGTDPDMSALGSDSDDSDDSAQRTLRNHDKRMLKDILFKWRVWSITQKALGLPRQI